MSEPFDITDESLQLTTARRHTEAPKRALVLPAKNYQTAFEAELLGRVGKNKIKIRGDGGATFAVDRFRLHAVEKARGQARTRLTVNQLDALPWLGAGRDPLLPSEMT